MSEIVIVMGIQAAGKSTKVEELVAQGYHRLNRDLMGGTIDQQAEHAVKAIQSGKTKVVLDNTYPNVDSRKSIIAAGKQVGADVRCMWLATSLEDAQVNICLRMLKTFGRVLGPGEFKGKGPNIYEPKVMYAYRNKFEEPTTGEGFASVTKVKFVRTWEAKFNNKALILDYDGTLRESCGAKNWPEKPDDVRLLPRRRERLEQWKNNGYLLLGASNQSAVAKGLPEATARECFEWTNKLLKHEIEVLFCPHSVPPVSCYCRKPAPAMGITHIWNHCLNPADCVMVGDKTEDKTFAGRCGFQFVHADEFFA